MDDHGLLFNAFIYLLAAVVAVPITKRLGFGAVLGYLGIGPLLAFASTSRTVIRRRDSPRSTNCYGP